VSKFIPLLKSVAERIDLPQPAKSRILAEIASDLDGLYEHYLNEGSSPEEAQSKAAEVLDLSDEALEQLVDVHQSLFRRWMDSLSLQAQTRWERGLFSILVLILLATGIPQMSGEEFFQNPSPFIWPVAVLGLVSLLFGLWKCYQIYLRKDHRMGRVHQGLPTLIFFGLLATALGAFGFSIELYLALEKLIFNYEGLWLYLIQWLELGLPLLLLSFTITLATALTWFTLINKVQKIVTAELSFLHDSARS
jgi:hypothetical protein